MKTIPHRISNGDGWSLALTQTYSEAKLIRGRSPIVIVPGYGMNSFIFSYHPRGLSMEGHLAEAGYEVWRVDLRAQGDSKRMGGTDIYGLEDLALTDLGVAIGTALDRTRTGADRTDLIGASLGGTLMFLHAVLQEGHRIGKMVCMGTPVRWVKIHPVLKTIFASPTIAGLISFKDSRRLVTQLLPFVARAAPRALSIYMNPSITDITAAPQMARTVEDLNPSLNRQLARWIWSRDLVLNGTNVSEALNSITQPLLCVLANGDGIVPRETAEFPYHQVSSPRKSLLAVGGADHAMAHADMFVSNEAHARVFQPITEWLAES